MTPQKQCLAHRLQHEFPPALNKGARLLYVTDHPRDAVMAPDYFLPAADRLRRSDIIRIIIESRAFDETCEVVVAESSRQRVVLEPWSPWRRIPGQTPAVGAQVVAPMTAAQAAIQPKGAVRAAA